MFHSYTPLIQEQTLNVGKLNPNERLFVLLLNSVCFSLRSIVHFYKKHMNIETTVAKVNLLFCFKHVRIISLKKGGYCLVNSCNCRQVQFTYYTIIHHYLAVAEIFVMLRGLSKNRLHVYHETCVFLLLIGRGHCFKIICHTVENDVMHMMQPFYHENKL